MQKEFIPYEQALALKELGFDEPCIYVYLDRDTVRQNHGFMNYPKEIYSGAIKTPLHQQAFRWFREEYNLDSFVKHLYKNTKKVGYYFGIDEYKSIEFQSESFKTYAEAELACLNKLIEIAKSI